MVGKKGYESPNVSVIFQKQDVIATSGPEQIEDGTNLSFDGYVNGWW